MFTRFSSAAPTPCLSCNRTELDLLFEKHQSDTEACWIYDVDVPTRCERCSCFEHKLQDGLASVTGACTGIVGAVLASSEHPKLGSALLGLGVGSCVLGRYIDNSTKRVAIPLPVSTVGFMEKAIHSASVSTSGSAYRAHGSFISHLVTMECEEVYKQALCAFAPHAMLAFIRKEAGAQRKLLRGHQKGKPTDTSKDKILLPDSNDCPEGMPATRVDAESFGKEERVQGVAAGEADTKILAHQIGPDLIPTEVMDSCESNLKAGLAKRVQPLPFKADKHVVRKIEHTVSALLKHVFSASKIKQWRNDNPCFDDFASSKWSSERWRRAVEEALADVHGKIEQTFQIKENEALPAKGKAPRPIIQCGDRAQAMMNLPVKCFEELLFEHFEEASIKHLPKYDAMERVAQRFKMRKSSIIEGDGSAWDACCNPTIRKLTENRILEYIITVLGEDHEVPFEWMRKTLDDMKKEKIKGKAKVTDTTLSPLRIVIESIRQSGHRGTSCFNYLINLVCWLVVVCEHPEKMIQKRSGKLEEQYISARDGCKYTLRYAFEGDDSVLISTEDFSSHQEAIEKVWTSMGFRMKLVFVKNKMTFTGFDFLCGTDGCRGPFIPEIARNIASASWSCSSELKSFPWKKHVVGAAAYLARAENFKDCGAFCRFFAAIGLAHVRIGGDREIGEDEAKKLGILPAPSVARSLQELYDSATVMTSDVRELVGSVVKMSVEQEAHLLAVDFGSDPFDTALARAVIPVSLWDPDKYEKPRR